MTVRAFTPEQELEILQMRAVGIPTRDIIAEFDGRKNAVYAVFHRAGVPLPSAGPTERAITPHERAGMRLLWEDGHGLRAIAQRTGRSMEAVRRELHSQGVDIKPRRRRQGSPASTNRSLRCVDCGSHNVRSVEGD